MNILHISPYFPDPLTNHAGGITMGHEIEELRKLGDVRVLSFISQPLDEALAAGAKEAETVKISAFSRALHIAFLPRMPQYFAARSSLRFWHKLVRAIKKYNIDLIYAEYLQMGQYMAVKRLFPHIVFHLVAHDVCSESYERRLREESGLKRLWLKAELKKIKKYEKLYLSKADKVLTFSAKDKRLIEDISGRKDIELIHTYVGIPDEELTREPDLSLKEEGNILYLGQMARRENALAAMRLIGISEKVRESYPKLRLYIVGNKPGDELIKLAAAKDYVTLTGYVDDVDIYIKRASLAVFPLTLGAGIKVKVLRSMALGTPVITGSVGAEGIDEEGRVIRLAETDEEYIEEMLRALGDPDGTMKLGLRSHEFIREHFLWSETAEVFKRLYGG